MGQQGEMFGERVRPFRFDGMPVAAGPTYDPAIDGPRLEKQFYKVLHHMLTHDWRTLAEIREATGEPEASISARLRAFRKPECGGYDVQKRRRQPDGGTWEYLVRPRAGHGVTRDSATGSQETAA